MVTFEQALETAKKLKPNCDACDEYNDAYLFKRKADEFTIGGDSPCIVLKESGKAINVVEYFDNYDAEHVREFDLE